MLLQPGMAATHGWVGRGGLGRGAQITDDEGDLGALADNLADGDAGMFLKALREVAAGKRVGHGDGEPALAQVEAEGAAEPLEVRVSV